MNALILAAGFGTRMGSLSKKTAKPLLPVAGKPVIQHLAEKIFGTGKIERLYIVTNHYYYDQFASWARSFRPDDVELLDDGATSNENRLGAIADLQLAIQRFDPPGPLLVLAGDNLYGFDFSDLLAFHEEKKTDIVASYHQPDRARLQKTGVISFDEEGCVVLFEEKPQNPKSQFAVPCLYLLTPGTLKRVQEYLQSGGNPDAPGHFIGWLYTRSRIHAFLFDAPLYSIGDLASYERTCQEFNP